MRSPTAALRRWMGARSSAFNTASDPWFQFWISTILRHFEPAITFSAAPVLSGDAFTEFLTWCSNTGTASHAYRHLPVCMYPHRPRYSPITSRAARFSRGSLIMHANLQLATLLADHAPPAPGVGWAIRTLSDMKLRAFISPGITVAIEARFAQQADESATLTLETRNGKRVIGGGRVCSRPKNSHDSTPQSRHYGRRDRNAGRQ